MSLQGTLIDLPLEDLLNLAIRRNNRAILKLTNLAGFSNYEATIYIFQYELYAAWLRSISDITPIKCGEDVIHYLLGCADAQFYFDVLPEIERLPARNITSSLHEISLANIFRCQDVAIQLTVTTPPKMTQNLATNSSKKKFNQSAVLTITSQDELAGNTAKVSVPPNQPKPLNIPTQPRQQHTNWFSSLVARLTQL
jgi:hypothetical protein